MSAIAPNSVDQLKSTIVAIGGEINAIRREDSSKLLRILVSNGFDFQVRIESALKSNELTQSLCNSTLTLGNTKLHAVLGFVSQQIIARLWRGDDGVKIVDELQISLLKKNERFLNCLAFAGVKVSDPIDIAAGMRLVSASYFPSGTDLNMIFSGADRSDLAGLLGARSEGWADSALVIEREIPSPLQSKYEGESTEDGPVVESAQQNLDRTLIGKAHSAFVLSAATAPYVVAHFECIVGEGFFQGYTGGRMVPAVRPTFPTPPIEYDTTRVRYILELCRDFPNWEQIEISIDRLRSSRQASSYVAKAIEMGISLEALFMHGEKRENQEITNKMSTRAAWLLGVDPEMRQNVSALVKLAYGARSSAVHNGKLTDKHSEAIQRWSEIDQLCRDSIIRVLELKRFPNWSSLVLGGPA